MFIVSAPYVDGYVVLSVAVYVLCSIIIIGATTLATLDMSREAAIVVGSCSFLVAVGYFLAFDYTHFVDEETRIHNNTTTTVTYSHTPDSSEANGHDNTEPSREDQSESVPH